MDFSLWSDIEKRIAAGAPKGCEAVSAFEKRMRHIAMRTPTSRVRAAVAAMRTRATNIWVMEGKNISRD